MLGNPGTYANKKRKKPVLKQKKINDGNGIVKSNPSKRHRDRLNGELDRLMELLPFSEDVRSRLDKLSVLRLSVGYLRVKSHFKATMKSSNTNLTIPGVNGQNRNNMDAVSYCEGDLLLQALNGFVIVVTSNGLVFYSSSTIKDYLGFHQSDVVHQSVYDLIHTDDRATFREQLHFALNPPPLAEKDILQCVGNPETYHPEQLPPENSSFLERNFVCRFRCLLDNSSGFLALKFKGRLKYLHSQSFLNGSSSSSSNNNPQLGLFTIATPVQPPSIVEIRAKMLLFQTKHHLDFTPTGIDSRGKIILGYSEIELCMKGSGYQFIHAADMMYCADNHIRMIKTGESGLTVFRLLNKSGSWQWVKSNAKLILKGGRPEFIIAYQRALSNAEGEAFLRQRRLQLPFGFTTGEAVLYNTSPTMDVSQHQFNKLFGSKSLKTGMMPSSLLDCFLSQEDGIYTQTAETALPVDQVFMDSRALVSVPSNSWQEATEMMEESGAVKEEAKQSMASLIDSLEKMSESGDFSAALQNLDVDDAALMELENNLKSFSQVEGQQSSVMSELDSHLTDDVFDYIDSVLFKEKEEGCLGSVAPSCLSGGNRHDFPMTAQFPEVSGPQLFKTPSPGIAQTPIDGLYSHQHDTVNGGGITEPSAVKSPSMFTQKLSHQGPVMLPVDPNLPPIQQLQLQDILSPYIELPELTVPPGDASSSLQSCGRPSVRHVGVPPQVQQTNQLLLHPNTLQPSAENGPLLQNSAQLPKIDILPPLIPSKVLSSSTIPHGFSVPRLQESLPFEICQSWKQSQQQQQQRLPHTNIVQNGHEKMLSFQSSERQALPCTGFWPRSVTELNNMQQQQQQQLPVGGQPAPQSSCMFDQHFSSGPAGGTVLAQSGSTGLRGGNPYQDQSPPQGSHCFQWGHSEPVVGTSAISQENVNISPLTVTPHPQLHLNSSRPMQNGGVTAEHNGYYMHPPQDVTPYLME